MRADVLSFARRHLPLRPVPPRPGLPMKYPSRYRRVPVTAQPPEPALVGRKLREWGRRYLLAEVVGTLSAVTVAVAAMAGTHSLPTAALAASIGESVGFYAVIVARTVPALHRRQHGPVGLARLWSTGKAAAAEACDYVVAEAADTLVIRPGLIYVASTLFASHLIWGFVIGKLAADVGFYLFVIPSYELRKKLTRPPVTVRSSPRLAPLPRRPA